MFLIIYRTPAGGGELFFIYRTLRPTGKTPQGLKNHGHDLSEGSEFLDDAIRIEDLPESDMEENIADGKS